MSGIELAGVLLGAFPLIIAGLEHWRDVAKVGGFFWRVRSEYIKCRTDLQYHEILYRGNLKELLLPIVGDADEVARLASDPGGEAWKNEALQARLEARLEDSYGLYMEIIHAMNETAEDFKKALSFDKQTVQKQLAPPASRERRSSSPRSPVRSSRLASAKSKWDYETFRLKFSFSEPVRKALVDQLKEYNDRLKRLLSSSDKISALQAATPGSTKQTSALETAFKKAWKKSDLLFKALQKSWQCSCQQYHFANLRLEHRRLPEICFEVILMFVAPSSQANPPWSWKELRCGQMIGCSHLQNSTTPSTPTRTLALRHNNSSMSVSTLSSSPSPSPSVTSTPPGRRKVTFESPAPAVPRIELDILTDPSIRLCQLLGTEQHGKCLGVISQDDETYHLHPSTVRERRHTRTPITLDCILSGNFESRLTRRQRYSIALLVASSAAQLQFTPWLRTGLTKDDLLFFPCEENDCAVPHHEPFIRQGFPLDQAASSNTDANNCNFYSLGIILLELCFGQRLEDQPLRKKHPAGTGDTKQAFDLMAALGWSHSVADEAGDDYASAVRWCFTGANLANQSWRREIIKNVVRPLEICQEHFGAATV